MAYLETRVPPPLVALIAAALMWLVARSLPAASLPFEGRIPIAVALATAGLGLDLAGAVQFFRAKTTVNPMKPQASSSLVVTGLYRRTRNPMYFGFLLALAGWAVFLSNAVAALLLPAFVLYMNRFQILPEERALAARFGEQFAAYRRSVRRWI